MNRQISDTASLALKLVPALLRRPHLIATAVRQALILIPRRWWATSPRVPVPRRDYIEFRQVTLAGDPDAVPDVRDVLVWLEWCRSMRALPQRV